MARALLSWLSHFHCYPTPHPSSSPPFLTSLPHLPSSPPFLTSLPHLSFSPPFLTSLSFFTTFLAPLLHTTPLPLIPHPSPSLPSLSHTLTLLPHLLLSSTDGMTKSFRQMVAYRQHETWATLGFLRGVSTSRVFSRAFCSSQWIELIMGIIQSASPLASYRSQAHSIVQQVCTRDLKIFVVKKISWFA